MQVSKFRILSDFIPQCHDSFIMTLGQLFSAPSFSGDLTDVTGCKDWFAICISE